MVQALFGSLEALVALVALLTMAGILFEIGRYVFSKARETGKEILAILCGLIVLAEIALVLVRSL